MKIISMVPSWTETLLMSGIQVVGRTRYCIHPDHEVKRVAIVGGTKEWDLALVRKLDPDFILLDKEENSKEMFEAWPEKCIVTHIEKVEDVAPELALLNQKFENVQLRDFSERWQRVAALEIRARSSKEIPGVLKWIKPIDSEIENLVYVIWRKPWMTINQDTFIASVLTHLGLGERISRHTKKYYEFEMQELLPKSLLLFSSEPYPFLKMSKGLNDFGAASAIVNGEDFSWFGVRSLVFLEKFKN